MAQMVKATAVSVEKVRMFTAVGEYTSDAVIGLVCGDVIQQLISHRYDYTLFTIEITFPSLPELIGHGDQAKMVPSMGHQSEVSWHKD